LAVGERNDSNGQDELYNHFCLHDDLLVLYFITQLDGSLKCTEGIEFIFRQRPVGRESLSPANQFLRAVPGVP